MIIRVNFFSWEPYYGEPVPVQGVGNCGWHNPHLTGPAKVNKFFLYLTRYGVDNTQGILIGIPYPIPSRPPVSLKKEGRPGPVKGHMALILVPDIHHGMNFIRWISQTVITHPLLPVSLCTAWNTLPTALLTIFLLISLSFFLCIPNTDNTKAISSLQDSS